MTTLLSIIAIITFILISPFVVFLWMKFGTFGFMSGLELFRNNRRKTNQKQ